MQLTSEKAPKQHDGIADYDIRVHSLLDRYRNLVNKTNDTLFKWWAIEFVGVPDLEGMPKWRSRLYGFISPTIVFSPSSPPAFLKFLSLAIWFFMLSIWVGLIHVEVIAARQIPSSANQPQEPISLLFTVLALFIWVVPIFMIYGYTIWYMTTSRNTWKTKLSWIISLIVIVLLILFNQIQDITGTDIVTLYKYNSRFFWMMLFLLVLPVIILITFFFLYFFKLIVEVVVNLVKSLLNTHQPFSTSAIRVIATKQIGIGDSGWSFSELHIDEIQALKELAKSNLDATEKKTIPAVIILALGGFLAATPTMGRNIGDVLQSIFTRIAMLIPSRTVTKLSIGDLAINSSIVLLFLIIITIYLVLFRNLIVQGIIVQVCIAAEFGKTQVEEKNKANETSWFWQLLRKIILAFQGIKDV